MAKSDNPNQVNNKENTNKNMQNQKYMFKSFQNFPYPTASSVMRANKSSKK